MPSNESKLRGIAVSAIRKSIVHGEYAFGARLSDRTLAVALGVSRTPVREALAELASEGLIEIRPQSGSFVVTPDVDSIRAVCEMRAVLECGALRLAAGRDPDQLAATLAVAIAGAAIALERGDLARVADLDEQFHNSLVGCSANPLLIRAYRGISDQVSAFRHRMSRDAKRMGVALAQHRRILDLTLTDNMPAAETELAAHVRNVQGRSIDVLRAAPK